MRYLCTIFTHSALTGTATRESGGSEPTVDGPFASGIVAGATTRDAAARAYVRFVGRHRAQDMRRRAAAPERILSLETNPRAIAPSLRKVTTRRGECYQMDNLVDTWSIKVEPLPASVRISRRSRLSLSRLRYLSSFPSPN